MAIILKKVIDGKDNLEMDSNTIIGIIGENSFDLIKVLKGSNIFIIRKENNFKEDMVLKEMKLYSSYDEDKFQEVYLNLFKELGIKENFIEKEIDDLSDSERRLLKYITGYISNKSIIIIEEPFLDLDYSWKKKITYLINNLHRNTKKNIIICSDNSNVIYLLCKKVLLVKTDKCYYGDVDQVFASKSLLKKYNIIEPEIVRFVNLVHEKNINLGYVKDIRDLMKEVYKSV